MTMCSYVLLYLLGDDDPGATPPPDRRLRLRQPAAPGPPRGEARLRPGHPDHLPGLPVARGVPPGPAGRSPAGDRPGRHPAARLLVFRPRPAGVPAHGGAD